MESGEIFLNKSFGANGVQLNIPQSIGKTGQLIQFLHVRARTYTPRN